jgi:hypothetical protein
VPSNKDLKRLVRARMAETGENYTRALAGLLGEQELAQELEPLPEPWHLTGSAAADYQVGLLPGTETYQGHRIVLLRSRPEVAEPAGFGAFVQSIRATRYLGRRVQFTAMARTESASGWGGLWLRVDGPGGTAALDNMHDRPLRETTAWAPAAIVMDVPENARSLSFGALLSRAGALLIAEPRFATVDETVPVTTRPFGESLPEEPQALDF